MAYEKDDFFGYGNKTREQIAIEILEKNPNAAVVDPRLLDMYLSNRVKEKKNKSEKRKS